MSIKPASLGSQVVTTPGTPQPIAAAITRTKRWVLTPLKTYPATANVGNIYVGTSTMNKATGTGVYRIVTPTSLPLVMDKPDTTGESWNLNDWYVDADNGTDAFTIGYEGQ